MLHFISLNIISRFNVEQFETQKCIKAGIKAESVEIKCSNRYVNERESWVIL